MTMIARQFFSKLPKGRYQLFLSKFVISLQATIDDIASRQMIALGPSLESYEERMEMGRSLMSKLLEEHERLIEIHNMTERKVSVTSSMSFVHKLKKRLSKSILLNRICQKIMVKQRLSITHG